MGQEPSAGVIQDAKGNSLRNRHIWRCRQRSGVQADALTACRNFSRQGELRVLCTSNLASVGIDEAVNGVCWQGLRKEISLSGATPSQYQLFKLIDGFNPLRNDVQT